MRRRSKAPVVDSHDASALRLPALRTRLLRVVLVAAAISLLALATWTTRGRAVDNRDLVAGSGGVVVLDLSLSISRSDYKDIRRTLHRLIADGDPVGLVIFSDVPYELLPPGTPVSELRPLLRLFDPGKKGPPVNPWSRSFSAGTQISSALDLARDMLVRDGIEHGSILLVSDLVTAGADVSQLARTLQDLEQQSISVRVVPLSPLRDGRTIVEGLLGKSAFIEPSRMGDPRPVRPGAAALPLRLLLLGAVLLVVLAAHERFAGALGLPSGHRSHV